ncbi:importin-5 [Nilaparvata lugens]|uniref:importin-5 n=1 Tax=Nilaparvata lugens TaxID=108931 RepID=UPI00193E31C7|nr:importin-5 [Nilaparvata lugens]
MEAEQEQFQQILTSLLSSENAIRSQGEEAYNNIPLDNKVVYLLNVITNQNDDEAKRVMATVLLRRIFSIQFTDFYPKLSEDSQRQLKARLLVTIQSEQSDTVRKKVCDITTEVARNLIDDDGNNLWPEFLQFMFENANSPAPALREAALHMFTSVPGVFGNHQSNYLDVIKQMLQRSLEDATSYSVRFQAVRAVSAFVLLHDKEAQIQKHFSDLLPICLRVCAESVERMDDDALLKCFIELAETTPKFLRAHVENIVHLGMNVLTNESLDDPWRHLGLEVIVTLAETAPAMMRKEAGKYIPVLVPVILKMMTDIEEIENWSVSDEVAEDDNDSNNVVAESALDRLACGLGGKTILPHIVNNIPSMLSNPDWKFRYGALMAISAVGEGCHKQMEAMLPQIMDGVLSFLSDAHPRVRYAACNAIGQMSTDFAPTFEKKFHENVIPGLLMVLEDNDNPRVQAHAGQYIYYIPFLLILLITSIPLPTDNKFKELVEKGTKHVLEQVVTTIASVADTSEEQFVAYYDRLMPCLKYIIMNANTDELKMLRGKTIECVSLIGLAVGAEKFMNDASEIMDMLLKTHTEGDLPDDDPQTSYLISAWARICKILGKRFEQYLPLVIGPVMRTASLKPEVALVDNDEMDDVSGDIDWQFVSLGEQQNFGIRTAGLEDKASACEMLVCYARELKEGFAEYAEQVVKLMVPMLKFYFHDGVRTAAAQSMPCLLECAQIKGAQFVQGMWQFICPELIKAIDTEPEDDVITELMYSLAKCIEFLGNGCLTEEAMQEVLKILDKLLKEHFNRAVERLEKRKDEDYDEVVEEQLLDEDSDDVYILSKVADIIHALFTAYKADFFPYFDQVVEHFVKMLGADRSWSDHQWALCVFDDVIEFGGAACAKYQGVFLQPMLALVTDKSPEVRQAAVYGCGVLGQFGGPAFAATCAEAIPRLVEVINDAEAKAPEYVHPTENAVSAVTKILRFNHSAINRDEILPHWLSWLPVWEDADEAPHVYDYLCELMEANHPVILGANNANLPRLVAIMAEAFAKEAVAPGSDVAKRMLIIVRQLQGSGEMFQACVAQLTPEQQVCLHEALSGAAN